MRKCICLFFVLALIFSCSSSKKNVLPPNASSQQILEWSKSIVIEYIKGNLQEGENYQLLEWILAEQENQIPVEVFQTNHSISGCLNLLDTRGIFDELTFIGKGDSAFVALAAAYTIGKEDGNNSFFEKTFTLDKNGNVLDCSDYISPAQKRKLIEENFKKALEQMGSNLIQSAKEGAAMAGRDTTGIRSVVINGKIYTE